MGVLGRLQVRLRGGGGCLRRRLHEPCTNSLWLVADGTTTILSATACVVEISIIKSCKGMGEGARQAYHGMAHLMHHHQPPVPQQHAAASAAAQAPHTAGTPRPATGHDASQSTPS